MTKRINIGALFLSAQLVLSSIAIWSRIHDSTKSSGDTVNLSMTSGYSPPLKCDTALINPTEFDPNLMTAGCVEVVTLNTLPAAKPCSEATADSKIAALTTVPKRELNGVAENGAMPNMN